jgi:hypothetical protein
VQDVEQIAQFQLFQTPSLKILQWEALPCEMRLRTVAPLARLLRERHTRKSAAKHAEETCDE